MSDTVANNMVVGLEYSLRLDDGEEVDRSEEGEPLEYLHGHRNIIPGLESKLVGLKVGDSKDVKVSPADGYGERDSEGVLQRPRGDFPTDLDLEIGTMLHVRAEDGAELVATITEVEDDMVTLDFNHPLAGETLHFSVKVVSLREATQEELSHGHAHGAHGHH